MGQQGMERAGRRISLVVKVLIAIFVLFVVAGILLQTPGGGRRFSCVGNLRQLMLGIINYASDYHGSFPTHIPPGEGGRTTYRDLGILYPSYVSSLQVFTCPQSRDRMPEDPAGTLHDTKPFPPHLARNVSYAYGLNKNANNKAWTDDAPHTTRVLADRPAARVLTKRSNHKTDGRNVAFADAHVRWISRPAPLDSDPENPDPTKHGTGPDWWSER